ncbi:Neutral/alkaline nonlysosomal ceramidase [Pseudomassariella vexata]|uniref:Neutral ceramidase n=1 Tax=Pseudomassariella vexata TaxID=1141098 RepID=A0A1Y2EBS0_9PEZI|nr:Neutral/alkaline nonlysosomal ceramidase [Pseudomassariella vexata]ORY68716.1 Neutral/alkaline nonlysosomal ceramidase [Pseudomassariella vexata]
MQPTKITVDDARPPGHRSTRASFIRKTISLLPFVLLAAIFVTFTWPSSKQYVWGPLGSEETQADLPAAEGDEYLLGVGKGDITGPCVEINLMGYADPKQIGTGLRQRLYSRAFIIGDPERPSDRFVYLVLDTQSGDTAVRYGILKGLKELGPEYAYYGHHNLAVTGTHSHSGPGAWLNYLLPQITSKGFNQQSYRAIVDGAVLSIQQAHEKMVLGHLSVGTTKVFGANINRSLYAYLANPEAERARYNTTTEDDGSVEKDLTLLKFQRASDKKNIGVLTWFPTHGTSVLGNNTLISGDNKGVAAKLFEDSVVGDKSAAEGFVAGFSQASVGDTSPNVLGAWCEDGSGQMCNFENSTCSDGKVQHCHARGPLFTADDTGTSSCYEIGKRQFEPARKLYDGLDLSPAPVQGRWVKSFHNFHNMSSYQFVLPNGTQVRTCPAALGYSFAAGTSDGPGVFDFTQHDGGPGTTSPVWQVVSGLLKAPSEEQKACHSPKPILLDVGEMTSPYMWTPNVVDMQVFRVGQFVIIVSPGEATTMAGRRWKNAVAGEINALLSKNDELSPVVVLGGPANSYTHYITTEEEYGIQRYEGASTLYGPHTLAAYINVTLSLIPYLSASSNKQPPMGPQPPDNSNRSLSFVPGVVHDKPPIFKAFGDVITDVRETYRRGTSATVVFVGANPRNSLRLERSYAMVEKLIETPADLLLRHKTTRVTADGADKRQWIVVRDDSDWHLVFRWRRTSELLATSEVEITWETEEWTEPGIYRLKYYGNAKSLSGEITEFEGISRDFTLI